MTIAEALDAIDDLKPNSYTNAQKIDWLSKLDWIVKQNILDTHEYNDDETEVTYSGYTSSTATTTTLLVPEPYTAMYIYWLEWHIDYHNGEPDQYNNAVAMYQSVFSDYANYYNRTHTPKQKATIRYSSF